MSPNVIPFRRYLRPDQTVLCDRCQKLFAPAENTWMRREGEIEEAGLRCPHCGHETLAVRTDAATRMQQERVRRAMVSGNRFRVNEERRKLRAMLARLSPER